MFELGIAFWFMSLSWALVAPSCQLKRGHELSSIVFTHQLMCQLIFFQGLINLYRLSLLLPWFFGYHLSTASVLPQYHPFYGFTPAGK